ncbi:MAG: iron-containing alcohol dehydrogenase [Nitrospinae bacterium]|nr:iron-containing alcohol dehydrogenase [Nitrospinota bacterium]
MQDFHFHNPTRVIFGRNKSIEAGETVIQFGYQALLVYGRESIKESGLYQSVTNSLRAAGAEVVDHGGVQPNPTIAHVREGVEKAKSRKLEVILAVGGGSVMDEAKAIAAGATAECDPWRFFSLGQKPERALPVITVPTLAATGSEMNGNAVITNTETRQKLGMFSPLLYPKVSILDPSLTLRVPPNHTAYGLADIFSHILEPYFNGADPVTPVQDRLAEGLFQSLFDIAPRLRQNPSDYPARADMLWASTVALNGILAAGRGKTHWDVHLLAHSLGALFNAPHGGALAVIIPGWMARNAQKRPAKFDQFANRVMGAKAAEEGIAGLKEWFRGIGAPVSLGELGIKESDIPAIVENVMDTGGGGKYTQRADIEQIMRLSL